MLAWTHLTPTCSVFFWGDIPILVKLSQILVFFMCVFFSFFGSPNPICFQNHQDFGEKIQVLMDQSNQIKFCPIKFWLITHILDQIVSNQSNPQLVELRWGQDSNPCASVSRACAVGDGDGWSIRTNGWGDRGTNCWEPPLGWALQGGF
jgi:hypothetical protein